VVGFWGLSVAGHSREQGASAPWMGEEHYGRVSAGLGFPKSGLRRFGSVLARTDLIR
jgi:hypothetical protein